MPLGSLNLLFVSLKGKGNDPPLASTGCDWQFLGCWHIAVGRMCNGGTPRGVLPYQKKPTTSLSDEKLQQRGLEPLVNTEGRQSLGYTGIRIFKGCKLKTLKGSASQGKTNVFSEEYEGL